MPASIDYPLSARFGILVNFAYHMYLGDPLNPTPLPDPGIAASGYQLLYYLQAIEGGERKFYGYLASSLDKPTSFVIVVRGTETFLEWLLDFSALPVLLQLPTGAVFVALGFKAIFDTFVLTAPDGDSVSVVDAIGSLLTTPGISELIIAGHSLGAALSTLLSLAVVSEHRNVLAERTTSFTFASPAVGLPDFAAMFNETVVNSYRIWNVMDLVPYVPTPPYFHVSGLGDPLVQSVEQLNALDATPPCEHNLETYLWLLDPLNYPVPPHGCIAKEVSQEEGAKALALSTYGRIR